MLLRPGGFRYRSARRAIERWADAWQYGRVSGPEFAPSAKDAIQVAESFFAERVESCVRFTTGLRHWVYDVTLAESARRVVVRLSHPDHRRELAGGVFWHDQLAAAGVPSPQ